MGTTAPGERETIAPVKVESPREHPVTQVDGVPRKHASRDGEQRK